MSANFLSDESAASRGEIDALVSHCRNLVIKDSDLAEALETEMSLKEASRYMETFYGVDRYPTHDKISSIIIDLGGSVPKADLLSNETIASNSEARRIVSSLSAETVTAATIASEIASLRERYLGSYVDLNPYYARLQREKGITPALARAAQDFDVLYEAPATHAVVSLFKEKYSKARRYFVSTMYTKAFIPDSVVGEGEYALNTYKAMCRMAICLMTIVECVHTRLERPFDIEQMSEYHVDQLLFSFGFTEFRSFPLKYKKRIVDSLNRLISKKGTDAVFVDILNLFDYRGVSILKYHLVVDRSTIQGDGTVRVEKDPRFVLYDSTRFQSLTDAVQEGEYEVKDFHSIVDADKTWMATKEEVASVGLPEIRTKYFSLTSHMELMQNVLNTSFFINLVKRIRREQPGRYDLEMRSARISSAPLSLEHVIVAMQSLVCDFFGMEDNIVFSESGVGKIYSFALQNPTDHDKAAFGAQGDLFALQDVSAYPSVGQDQLVDAFATDLSRREAFQNYYGREARLGRLSPARVRALKAAHDARFVSSFNLDVYAGYTKYSDWVEAQDAQLGAYVRKCMDETDVEVKKDMVLHVMTILSDYAYRANVQFERMFADTIVQYLMVMINVFKSYTVTMRDFLVFYSFNEQLFFSYYEDRKEFARFDVSDTLVSSLTVYAEFFKRFEKQDRMNVVDIFGSFKGKFVSRERLELSTKHTFKAKMAASGAVEYADVESFSSWFGDVRDKAFLSDALYDYRTVGTSYHWRVKNLKYGDSSTSRALHLRGERLTYHTSIGSILALRDLSDRGVVGDLLADVRIGGGYRYRFNSDRSGEWNDSSRKSGEVVHFDKELRYFSRETSSAHTSNDDASLTVADRFEYGTGAGSKHPFQDQITTTDSFGFDIVAEATDTLSVADTFTGSAHGLDVTSRIVFGDVFEITVID